ncbi:MAG: hypothetical protein JWP61_1804 [Friedmanniella sp.]|nr:hypothetical protein [Friedmanniella sp.]
MIIMSQNSDPSSPQGEPQTGPSYAQQTYGGQPSPPEPAYGSPYGRPEPAYGSAYGQPEAQPGGYDPQTSVQPGYGQPGYGPPGYGQPGYGPGGYTPMAGEPASLDLPWYGISFVPAVKRVFQKYARFDGRASRGEYWWWALASGVVFSVVGLIAGVLGAATSPDGGSTPGAGFTVIFGLFGLVWLAIIVPALAVMVRRLHDAGFSGWMALLLLIPSLGGLIVAVLCVLPSNPTGARFDRAAA